MLEHGSIAIERLSAGLAAATAGVLQAYCGERPDYDLPRSERIYKSPKDSIDCVSLFSELGYKFDPTCGINFWIGRYDLLNSEYYMGELERIAGLQRNPLMSRSD